MINFDTLESYLFIYLYEFVVMLFLML